ncbi:hypothetical protein N8I77_011311 [Diaporthe amygdali]|uniref:Uncharacterized protein n=1 Tax=Phomopsis amygdali TaxID=1214568 RepID=A0AAD9VY71_PHOAM|nr:hypothetical protein N8I77_011311 [Diaporthe amygdali]
MARRKNPRKMARKRHRPRRKRKELKPFRFDSLPGEIHLEVYNHCFVFPISNTNVRLPVAESSPQVKQALGQLTAMSAVNKKMHDEVSIHFLQHIKIHWHGNFTNPLWQSFQNYALPYVWNLSLSIADYQLCWLDKAKIRRILVWMSIHSNPRFADCYVWNLRQLTLVVRNSHVDLARDDQVCCHHLSIDRLKRAWGDRTGDFPRITGLQTLKLEAPWRLENEWKDRLCREVDGDGGQCHVVFAKNLDGSLSRPRKSPWEVR